MAEFSTRRVVAVAAVAGALVGGAVAGTFVAVSTSGGGNLSSTSFSGASAPVATAAVVRTDLTTTVQVGGSIGFGGSYTVTAPSGASPGEVTQAEQAITGDQQTLSADAQTASDASSADDQAVVAAQTNASAASATLGADQAAEARDCAGAGATSAACGQDAQRVGQDEAALTQADQQVAAARSAATLDHDQNQAKVSADQTKLQGDEATLAALQATAVNPGTTFTSLPPVGAVITEDQPVYSLSDVPVPLLYGSIVAYRAFSVGMGAGGDVGELTRDLIALGYGAGLAPSDQYSAATAAAVKRWQAALGLRSTGEILLGEVVFEPGPVRVTSVTPSVGASVGGGGAGGAGGGGATVLTATSTTPIVTVDLPVTDESLVKRGDAVSIVLPAGSSTIGGRVESVGTVATCPSGGGIGAGGPGGGASTGQSPCEASGSGNTSTPTVPVTVTMDRTPPGATLDQAPVNVEITSQRADNVLAVPVDALLALQGGGFGVEVVRGRTTHLVGVTTGLYDRTMVQVKGSGVTVGTRVEVPST
jgi:hypothetical protein